MNAVYALCAVVLVAGFALAYWLKREGERSWARHREIVRRQQQREAFARVGAGFIRLQIAIRDDLTPALQRVGTAIKRLGDAIDKGAAS